MNINYAYYMYICHTLPRKTILVLLHLISLVPKSYCPCLHTDDMSFNNLTFPPADTMMSLISSGQGRTPSVTNTSHPCNKGADRAFSMDSFSTNLWVRSLDLSFTMKASAGIKQPSSRHLSNQLVLMMVHPLERQQRNLTVRLTLSVTRWVQLNTDSTISPPRLLTVSFPASSITPVNITLGKSSLEEFRVLEGVPLRVECAFLMGNDLDGVLVTEERPLFTAVRLQFQRMVNKGIYTKLHHH